MNNKMRYVLAIALFVMAVSLPYGRMYTATKAVAKQVVKTAVVKAVDQCTPDRILIAACVVTVGQNAMR